MATEPAAPAIAGTTAAAPAVITAPAPEVPAAPAATPATTLGDTLYAQAPTESTPATPAEPAAAAAATPETPVPPVEEKPETAAPLALTAESYKDLVLPEGLQVDDALFGEFKGTLAEVGVAPDKAPALLGLYHKALQAQQEANVQALQAQNTAWAAELSAMPEFQGERRTQASAMIGRAIEEFGTPEVRATLDAYGLGNNPALAKFIYSMAHALVEGTVAPPGGVPANVGGGRKGQTLGQRLYGNTSS